MNYYTQIRECEDGTFEIVGGQDPDDLQLVGSEPTYAKAQTFRAWWVASMGESIRHVNHGFRPLVPLQGHVPGH